MINHIRFTLFTFLFIGISSLAQANLDVSFNESAPKDWFEFTNNGSCAIESLEVQIDLSNSAGKLIFDTTATGEGVEVFQPFEVRSGDISLIDQKAVSDGDRSLLILIKNLGAGEAASFTIDVDDTLTNSDLGNIRVSDAEIFGGEITMSTLDGQIVQGSFDDNGKLSLRSPKCKS